MSDRRTKLEAVFHEAMDLASPEERERYLTKACVGDLEFRREVDELLKSAEAADAVFQAGQEACRVNDALPAVVVTEKPGDRIGRYKLLEQIGEGGMGVVYMAEQEQPVRRKVALKIIKLGMDTRQVVARFEAERQALALMDHPHIAKVLDAGATDSGRPYFVMELVQGVPITRFCDENRYSPGERIKLFIPVCQAIQSAHQKGVIHRDLKPSNVLVTLNAGVPHPMVIDFGVAKATNQKLTEKTLFTNFATMIGTPAYMSPEQAEMSKLDVDTRSDIYSLGVLLYELLTGSTPFPEERLRSVAYREMQRIIVEEEPERPSTRLKKKALTGSATPLVTRHSPLATDLDWIVMKCLEKDRDRRYDTANGLAADIQRHLNTEPIIARPPSTAYRFQKFVRRNKLQFAAAAFGMAVLLLAVAVSTWQAVRATRAEQAAREQTQNAEFIKDFLVQLVFKVNPYSQVLAVNPDVEPETEQNRSAMVERIARAVDTEFADHPKVEAELRMALAAAFVGLGDRGKPAVQFERAYHIRHRILGPQDSETLWALAQMAQAYLDLERRREAEILITNALAAIRSSPHTWSSGEAEVFYTYVMVLEKDKTAAEILPYYEEAMSVARRTQDQNDYHFKNKLWHMALLTTQAGRWPEAEALWAENIEQSQLELGAEHPLTAQFLKGQADFFMQRGRWREALTNLEQIIPIYHRTMGTNHNNGLDAESLLARVYEHEGRIEEATKLNESIYPRWAKYFPYPPARYHCYMIAQFLAKHRRYEGAKAAYELLRKSWETNPPENARDWERFIEATAVSRGWPAAAEMYRKNLDRFAGAPAGCRTVGTVFLYVGDEDAYRKTAAKAIAFAPVTTAWEEQLAILHIAARGPFTFSPEQRNQCQALIQSVERALLSAPDNQASRAHRAIGAMELRLGELTNALTHLETAAKEPAGRGRTLLSKALCLQNLNRTEEARTAFDEAEKLLKPLLFDRLSEYEGFLTESDRNDILLHREAKAMLGLK